MSRRIDIEDYKRMINSFRVTDLHSLITAFGRNHIGRKNELQIRAVDILIKPPLDINIEKYKQKIRELYKNCRDEQQMQLQHNMASNRSHQLQRNPANTYGVTSNQYIHQNQSQQVRNNLSGMNTVVYQNGVNNTTTYSYPPMYIQTSGVVECNLTNTAKILTQSVTSSNISFRKMPFFNIKYEILKPTLLISNGLTTLRVNGKPSNTHEFTFSFVLTTAMASEMAMHRDVTTKKNMVQGQLRMCAIDNTVLNTSMEEYDDFLPLGLVVRVNSVQCNTLPPLSPNSRPAGEQRRIPGPVDITQLLKLSPMNVNHVTINWTQEINKAYVITLNIVEKLSSSLLLDRLKEKPTISVDLTKLSIRKQYRRVIDEGDDNDMNLNADDDDIATTIVRVSLMCPLAKFRMIYPAKGKNCSHLQCFDGSAFISLNEKKSMWVCPVCHKRLSYDDLLIDQYFVEVLTNENLSEDCQEVQLLVDGSWKSYIEENLSDSNNEKQNSNSTMMNSPAASPASEKDMLPANSAETPSDDAGNNINDNGNYSIDTVVDLTCEDEDETSFSSKNISSVLNIVQKNSDTTGLASSEEKSSDVNSDNNINEDDKSKAQHESLLVATDQNIEVNVTVPEVTTFTENFTNSNALINGNQNSVFASVISLDSPSPPPSAMAALNIDDT